MEYTDSNWTDPYALKLLEDTLALDCCRGELLEKLANPKNEEDSDSVDHARPRISTDFPSCLALLLTNGYQPRATDLDNALARVIDEFFDPKGKFRSAVK